MDRGLVWSRTGAWSSHGMGPSKRKDEKFNISKRNGACLVQKKATENPKRNGAWSNCGLGSGLVRGGAWYSHGTGHGLIRERASNHKKSSLNISTRNGACRTGPGLVREGGSV